MDGPLDAGEIEDEDDEEYNPPTKKIKKEKNSDEENTSPQKKDQKLPKPTRFSMMLDDSSIVVNAPDPKPKIKKEPMVSNYFYSQLTVPLSDRLEKKMSQNNVFYKCFFLVLKVSKFQN